MHSLAQYIDTRPSQITSLLLRVCVRVQHAAYTCLPIWMRNMDTKPRQKVSKLSGASSLNRLTPTMASALGCGCVVQGRNFRMKSKQQGEAR